MGDIFILTARSVASAAPAKSDLREIPADVLEDKIRGGLLGQLFGSLNPTK